MDGEGDRAADDDQLEQHDADEAEGAVLAQRPVERARHVDAGGEAERAGGRGGEQDGTPDADAGDPAEAARWMSDSGAKGDLDKMV